MGEIPFIATYPGHCAPQAQSRRRARRSEVGIVTRAVLLTSALAVGVGAAVGWTLSAETNETAETPPPQTASSSTSAAPSPTPGPSVNPGNPVTTPGSTTAPAPTSAPAVATLTAPATGTAARPAPTGIPVYLTFDDGPDPAFTPQVLDALAAHGATATFFVQGSQVHAHPELTRRMAAEGHSVQNHAWNHPRLPELSIDEVIYSQLVPTNDAITAATGLTPTCLRAPFGAVSAEVYSAAAAAGLQVVNWDINPADYSDPGATQIAANVVPYLNAGSIVLLHDAGAGDRQQTVDALNTLLPELTARGYQPQALCR